MNIRFQLVFFFSLIIIFSVGLSSYFAILYTETSVLDVEIAQMTTHNAQVMHEIEILHQRASEDLVFALKNPKFVEYFELPETKAGNVYDENGVLQFTDAQREIKQELEQWIYHFQNKFSVDETCLIDTTGQEHARLVLSIIEVDKFLSSEESSAPFFEPSFMKQKDEVHLQYPYVSPDTNRWVFAYTSPVELDSGQKPAFYHFEMPITIFQELVSVDVGRMYVIDLDGFIIADSDDASIANARYNVNPQTITSFIPSEYFPSIQSVFASNTSVILDEIKANNLGDGIYALNGEKNHFVYEKLPTFDWVLVYEKPVSLMLVGNTSLDDLTMITGLIAISVSIIGIVSVIIISSRITKPITKLAQQISLENPERLEELETSDHEIGIIIHSVNDLIKKMTNYQEQIHLKNQELTVQKRQLERLADVGESASKLVHNLRNPLTVIKATVDLIKHSSKDTLDEASLEKLERIKSASESLEKQIQGVLTFVSEKPLKIKNIKLMDLILVTLKNMNIPDEIHISSTNSENYIQCDSDKLQIVLMNIITNSIEAMDKKGTIHINSSVSNYDTQIQIHDDGPGVSSENMLKIFDSLFTTKLSGTGLGLSYCKSVVEQHGGSIIVSSNPTTFTISLPRKTISKKSEK